MTLTLALFVLGVSSSNTTWHPVGEGTPCSGASASLDKTQCAAWQWFYDSCAGTKWDNCASHRNDPCGCTSAGGSHVTCVGADITHINMWQSNVVGPLPHSFGALPNLLSLFLGDNEITGSLPEWLASLDQLTMLSLQNNRLTGPVPAQLPFDRWAICGIGGTGNSFCAPLPPGAADCNSGGGVATKTCTDLVTPAPTPEPTPAETGCASCDDMYAAWGKFAPGLWNPKEWQDGCFSLQNKCTGVTIECPGTVSDMKAPPCKKRRASRAAVDATIGTIVGLACALGAFRLYRRHQTTRGAAGAAAAAQGTTQGTGAPELLASEYSQL